MTVVDLIGLVIVCVTAIIVACIAISPYKDDEDKNPKES